MEKVEQLEALAAIAKNSELPDEEFEKFLVSIPTRELIEATENENYYVREWAVYALKNRGGKAVELALIEVIKKDEHTAIIERAISSLSTKTSSKNVMEALIRRIEDEDYNIGTSAIFALGDEPNERIDKALVQALKDEKRNEIFGYSIITALMKREQAENRKIIRQAILDAVRDQRKMVQKAAERYISEVINAR